VLAMRRVVAMVEGVLSGVQLPNRDG
jgi:hypothetical protein